ATAAAATARGEVVGLVDAVDRFDPASAAAAGVDLDRGLWGRGPPPTGELSPPPVIGGAGHQAIRGGGPILGPAGVSIVALDVADVPARHLRALPWTTWLRLSHANEGRDTVCLLVGESPMGKSARGTSVHLEAARCWTGTSAQSRRLNGLSVELRAGVNGSAHI